MAVIDLEEDEGKGACVLEIYGNQCPPCKKLLPILEELSVELAGKVRFCKLEIEEAQGWVEAFNITSIPTLIFYDGEGNPAGTPLVGLVSKVALRAKILEYLKV